MQAIEEANKVAVVLDKPSWRCEERAVSCRALFFRDKETGGYTVIARNLPGVISEGANFEEAKQKITEAFIGALQSYAECGMEVPWGVEDEWPGDSPERELRLLVHLDA
ncbi:MAG: type II toxin-antitoxin system HicB family antitoxin [Aureliella sp.]